MSVWLLDRLGSSLVAVALGWLLFQDEDVNSGEPSQAAPRTAISGPITKEVVSENCVAALQEASKMLDRAAQALKDWRLHAKALTDYREGRISVAEARRRWDETTKAGWPGPTASTSRPRSTRRLPVASQTGWKSRTGVGSQQS
jgi:hypothetical protein